MNAEDHTSPLNNPESPFSDPQSPGLPHLHRHQPTTEHQDTPMQADGLRRRHQGDRDTSGAGSSSSSSSTMRIQIQTPFSDLGDSRRKEVVVDRALSVGELKDGLANGRWSDEGWIREGMRLVWRGRIVHDGEPLGDIVAAAEDGVHTFHLVAGRSDSLSRTTSRRPHPILPPVPSQEQRPAATIPSESLPLPQARGRASVALQDSLHYLYFIARHHLCLLLDSQPLAWDDTVPPPVIDQSSARLAVMSVIRGVAQTRMSREEGWEEWERAFDGVEAILVGEREALEKSMKGLWASTVGRAWSDEMDGNQVTVDFDGIPYALNLPPVKQITDRHLAHLSLYLRITSLIPLLLSVVEHESRLSLTPPPVPSPTRTIPALPQQTQARVLLRLRIPFIPASVLTHMAYSALKIAAMLWMLSRDMKWGDVRFWILSGAAAGWWVADALNAWVRVRPRVVVRPNAGPEGDNAAGDRAGAAGGPANAGAAQGRGNDQAQPPNARAPGAANVARPIPPLSFSSTTAFVPLIHLATDSEQLGHPSVNPNQRTRTPARRNPPRLQTQFLLPVILWVVTLIPDWENIRARMIRRRERAMRVVVGELTTAATPPGGSDDAETEENAPRQHIFPEGLNSVAKRYYERVLARGEGIDWEEEREAQRAMGIPDENAGAGGMGMGLLG